MEFESSRPTKMVLMANERNINIELPVRKEYQDLITEWKNYEWNDEKASVPIDEFNHLLDRKRYAFLSKTHTK